MGANAQCCHGNDTEETVIEPPCTSDTVRVPDITPVKSLKIPLSLRIDGSGTEEAPSPLYDCSEYYEGDVSTKSQESFKGASSDTYHRNANRQGAGSSPVSRMAT
mmetsp:Transcript_63714/g.170710  ORF Transcript_63714/g.170710 Transcript_63714/m.170710 type:complete len:105 (-) Transcript_63714:162-476(-)